MNLTEIPSIIARELTIRPEQVIATTELLDSSNTIPFIARYRKEVTGGLDEEQLRNIQDRLHYLRNLVKRQEEVVSSIDEQGKLTPELAAAIERCTKLQDLEDLYLPYRPKKRTRAQIARERGLEPLAERMLAQKDAHGNPLSIAAEFVNPEQEINSVDDALAGASDIVAETVAERADIRSLLRRELWRTSEIAAELAVPETEAKEFLTYKEYREPVRRMPSHRILAVNRGEARDVLKLRFEAPHDTLIDQITRIVIQPPSIWTDLLDAAIRDGYKRLLFPSLEREVRNRLTENAEQQAIRLFGLNLRQLLLIPPLAGHVVMGLDPGYRTGCKVAIINQNGTVLDTANWYLTQSENARLAAEKAALKAIHDHKITLIAIGNGTASYETEEFVARLIREHNLPIHYLITNEAGASVYSASKLAKDELPTLDVSLRGAVSIARRVQDPLAELVKIDPKSIGVGQYQHDVDQKALGSTLDTVVESAVNHVGVELNTASIELLQHVSGINASVAKNIVAYRDANGAFHSRKELLKVSRLGNATFVQCAGFLRLQEGTHPLDNTPVHPESYALAEALLTHLGFSLDDLRHKDRHVQLVAAVHQANPATLAKALQAGEPTIKDILAALVKPGRDPREDLPAPLTRKNIVQLSDLTAGSLVRGTVHNVTDFGAFVDIGVKVNGLIHRSELSDKPIRHPLDAVSVGDILDVVILSVDSARNRIALSLKQAKKHPQA